MTEISETRPVYRGHGANRELVGWEEWHYIEIPGQPKTGHMIGTWASRADRERLLRAHQPECDLPGTEEN